MKNWVVANWKMNGSMEFVNEYVPALLDGLLEYPQWNTRVKVVICPPPPYMWAVAKRLFGYPVITGAQNVSPEPNGARTGEVSCEMLHDLEVTVALAGHSERRQFYGEDDAVVAKKVAAIQAAGLTPIVCVGERQQEREAGRHADVVRGQMQAVLGAIDTGPDAHLIVAYEPVWAIGTGLTATPAQAGEMHALIRAELNKAMGAHGADVPILYGGSVNPENAAELMAEPEINGALVGGASLKPESFLSIIKKSLG